MRNFFKIKVSTILIFLVLFLIPFVFIAVFSSEGIRVVSDNTIGHELRLQIAADESLSEIMSTRDLRLGSVRSVSLPSSNPGKAEFSIGDSDVLIIQYRGLKEPYMIKRITIIRSGIAEVLYD